MTERNSSSCLESSSTLSVHLESAFLPLILSPVRQHSSHLFWSEVHLFWLLKAVTSEKSACWTACLLSDEIINTVDNHMSSGPGSCAYI